MGRWLVEILFVSLLNGSFDGEFLFVLFFLFLKGFFG